MPRKPGPKLEPGLSGQVARRTVLMDDLTLRRLVVLGDGNVSKGVREAARVAYDRYQHSKG